MPRQYICLHCSTPFLGRANRVAVFCSAPCRQASALGKGGRPATAIDQRMASKIQRTATCWLWTDFCDVDGYGFITYRGKVLRAHRLMWELTYGPIPKGLSVLHNCPSGDNPSCVNPTHLWLGTDIDNQRDKFAKGREARGERHGRAKLTAEAVAEIRQRYAAGEKQVVLGHDYGVTQTTVSKIVRNVYWPVMS